MYMMYVMFLEVIMLTSQNLTNLQEKTFKYWILSQIYVAVQSA